MDSTEQKPKRPIVNAACPYCGNSVKFYMPLKPGVLSFTCPAAGCGKQFRVQVTEAMLLQANSAATKPQQPNPQPQQSQPHQPQPQTQSLSQQPQAQPKQQSQPKVQQAQAQPQQQVQVQQAQAQQQKRSIKPTDSIENWTAEGKAGGRIAKVVVTRTKMIFMKEHKEYDLKIGVNVIGRADAMSPSDIMIEDDMTVSRRSVSITVEASGGSYRYWFEVLKSTNPVLVNGKRHAVGESFVVEPGTKFVLGRTKLSIEL
ncbi:FHA domain-containing protein [Prevotella stercorea]|uniref:FHA domain-containing protein n=1 Tax=Leyella stercorea TaxID=363265 RepID=UPI001F4040D7|nr:FHA domain-containing protein [Leyella stercorea]MCF2644228.1 FHA domain-containing protein [Leyella stercorea]